MNLFRKNVKLFLFTLILVSSCYAQTKNVPKELIPMPYQQARIDEEYSEYKKEAFELLTYLPKTYDKIGAVDYTTQLQKGIDENKIVLLPNFPILINSNGLTLNSGNVLLFQPKSKLILRPTSKDTYEILRVHGVNNVKIYNANIEGDSKRHNGKSGEWGMGIAMRSSSNVSIFNPKIEKCWGDGIYVGTLTKKVNGKGSWVGPSQNIIIYNAYVDDNRRNGLSLVSVKGCKVYNSFFSNTRGTFPKSGIDIEPLNFASGIDIKNVVTFNNGQDGIVISLVDLVKSRIKNYEIGITIDNHKDFNSSMGLRLTGYRDFQKEKGYTPLNGLVTITNSKWESNAYGSLVIQPNQTLGPTVKFIGNSASQKKSLQVLKGQTIKDLPSAKKGLTGKHSIIFQ